jgi:Glyoxalase-like domain
MKVIRRITVFDASDIDAKSQFWAGLLDGEIHRDDDWHSIVVDGEWIMGVQLAPNHVKPEWPNGAQQQQVHLDLHVDDLDAADERSSSVAAAPSPQAPGGQPGRGRDVRRVCEPGRPSVLLRATLSRAPASRAAMVPCWRRARDRAGDPLRAQR